MISPTVCGLRSGWMALGRRDLHIAASRLIIKEFGDPNKVVEKEDFSLETNDLRENEVLIRMMYSPINPADINTIQGVYGVKPQLPFVLGNEGVGKVEMVGSAVKKLSPGDWVIPASNAWGTWRSHAIDDEKNLEPVANNIDPLMAATLSVNPCTAYRMLHDFMPLSKGDTVLQNGSNSAVGQSVIEIARNMGLRTVNLIRNREGVDKLKQQLQERGADFVLTDEEFRKNSPFQTGLVDPPKLVLNCVSGKGVIDLVKAVADHGTIVTYGGMSRQPLTVPTASFIFKDIRLVGFWMTRWNWKHKGTGERGRMLNDLCHMARQGGLTPPKSEIVPVADFRTAMDRASNPSGFQNAKLIFSFN